MNGIYDETSSCESSASHRKVRVRKNVTRFYLAVSLLRKLRHQSDFSYLAALARKRPEMKPRCGFVAYPALLVHLQLQKL